MAFYGMARFASRFARRAVRTMVRRRPARAFVRRPRLIRRKKTSNKVHSFVRWCDKDSQYPSTLGPSTIVETGSDQNLVYTFKLDNVINPSDFTNLFDMYKINKVTVFLERYRETTGESGNSPYNRKIAVVWDDDGNALSGEDAYMEYGNCKRYNAIGSGAIKLVLYPKLSAPLLNVGGSNNAYQSVPSSRQWLKIEDDDIPHFALKIFVPSGITSQSYGIFNVRVKYHISLKNSI